MNEKQLAGRIRSALNHGTRQLDGDTLARLGAARGAALARHRATQPEAVLSGAAVGGGGMAFRAGSGRRRAALAAVLMAATLAVVYWQSLDQAVDTADIDAALLASDLPPKAYADPRFPAWIRRAEPQ
jgi:hypothetical protein